MKILLNSLVLFSCIGAAHASEPIEVSLKELYARSAEVAAITITKGEMINVGTVRCGARYTAQVERSFKKDSQEITFDSFNGLEVGANYLMFFKINSGGPDEREISAQSPEQIASCPKWAGEITPDLTYGTIKQPAARGAYEMYARLILLPKGISSSPPKRFDSDEFYGTVWADKDETLEYLEQLK